MDRWRPRPGRPPHGVSDPDHTRGRVSSAQGQPGGAHLPESASDPRSGDRLIARFPRARQPKHPACGRLSGACRWPPDRRRTPASTRSGQCASRAERPRDGVHPHRARAKTSLVRAVWAELPCARRRCRCTRRTGQRAAIIRQLDLGAKREPFTAEVDEAHAHEVELAHAGSDAQVSDEPIRGRPRGAKLRARLPSTLGGVGCLTRQAHGFGCGDVDRPTLRRGGNALGPGTQRPGHDSWGRRRMRRTRGCGWGAVIVIVAGALVGGWLLL